MLRLWQDCPFDIDASGKKLCGPYNAKKTPLVDVMSERSLAKVGVREQAQSELFQRIGNETDLPVILQQIGYKPRQSLAI